MEADSTNWREVLKQQQQDLKALQQQASRPDDDDDLDADIERVLRRPIAPSFTSAKVGKSHQFPASAASDHDLYDEPAEEAKEGMSQNAGSRGSSSGGTRPRRGSGSGAAGTPPRSGSGSGSRMNRSHQSQSQDQGRGGEGEQADLDTLDEDGPGFSGGVVAGDSVATPKAPEAGARFQKAKLKLLQKQLDEANEMRKRFSDQVDSLTHQLRNDREENKALKKRVQLLEVENKRSSSRKVAEAASGDKSEALQSEVNQLKKDIQSAERIVKQAEHEAKTKDTQLKRALETITRLKAQLAEQQQQQGDNGSGAGGSAAAAGGAGSSSALSAAQSRVQVLEKQRNDLIVAFRKQMKLIDLLKRQKMHVEASRLLSFTEEEFMKTLDWAV